MAIKQRNVPGIAWLRRPPNRAAAMSIAVRDRLLDAVVRKLREKRDTKAMADHLGRALAGIRSMEVQVRGKAYFAPAVELQAEGWISAVLNRTGKEKTWALVSEATTLGLLTDALADYDEQFPKASKADWKDVFQECWWDILGERHPLSEKVLTDVLAAKTSEGRALRLLYEKTHSKDDLETVEDFRKKLSRTKHKPFA